MIPEEVDEVTVTCACCLQERVIRKGERVICIDQAGSYEYWQKRATIIRLERWPNGAEIAVFRWRGARHLESTGAMWFAPDPASRQVQQVNRKRDDASRA